MNSVHGQTKVGAVRASCLTCHGSDPHSIHPPAKAGTPAQNTDCLACHADISQLSLYAHGQALQSADARLDCLACHGHNPHAITKPAAVAPAQNALCATCHADVVRLLAGSIHNGAGGPQCVACHGDHFHRVPRITQMTQRVQESACRNCHAGEATAWMKSVHGKSGGVFCLSCHGGSPHSIHAPAQAGTPAQNAVCLACHAADVGKASSTAHGKILRSADPRLDCLACHGHNPHAITETAMETPAQQSALCATCHADVSRQLAGSAHGNTEVQDGSRPVCVTCHGQNFHAVTPTSHLSPAEKVAECRRCHPLNAKLLAGSVHAHADTKTGKPAPDCLTCHGGGNPHAVIPPAKLSPHQQMAPCVTCHRDLSPFLDSGVHDRPDKVPGDHPTCLSCHGANPHGIAPSKHLTAQQKVALCARCHTDTPRMQRYGRVDAVSSYAQTFHGRAILLFGQQSEATCVDCHGIHGMLAPENPDAPVNPRHIADICRKCHSRPMYFAYSYASHLRLTVEHNIITTLTNGAFRLLNLGPELFLGCLVLLLVLRRAYRARPLVMEVLFSIYELLSLFTLLFVLTAMITARVMSHFGFPLIGWPNGPSLALLALTVLALIAGRWIRGLRR